MPAPTLQNPRIAGGRLSAHDPAVDADHFTTASDLILTTTARGFIPDSAGTLKVDFIGGIDGRAASTGISITVLAGTKYDLCFTKVYASSPSGTVLY